MLWEHEVAGSIPAIPKKEQYMKQRIVDALLVIGYKKKWEEPEGAVCLENDKLVLAIFDNDYPNDDRAGRVFAEHKENFDKWWSAFYKCTTPTNEDELFVLLTDLEYVSLNWNKFLGNEFSTLTRTF